jgi:hypothetical protein
MVLKIIFFGDIEASFSFIVGDLLLFMLPIFFAGLGLELSSSRFC